MKPKDIAVIGCRPYLPAEFPIDMPENSGNMIHAIAPLRMYPQAEHNLLISKEKIREHGSFVDYVNNSCSHLVITLANTIRLDRQDSAQYIRLMKSLERYKVPIVVFGFGIQASEYTGQKLCVEAQELIHFFASKSPLVGVRGELTKQIIEDATGIKNIYVTGCPSLFSNPLGLLYLKLNWQKRLKDESKRYSINVTNLQRQNERNVLIKGIYENANLIEPVSKISHQYHLDLKSNFDMVDSVPYYLKGYMKENPEEGLNKLKEFYLNNYYLFRDVDSWMKFNFDTTRLTVGTRFHVNMASILSGVPALWLTHDARTVELVNYFKLPHLSLDEIGNHSLADLTQLVNYDSFFNNLPYVLDRFNYYLNQNGLPPLNNYYE